MNTIIDEPNKGWVAIWRKTIDSEIWLQAPWRLKTWLYLISEANHADEQRHGQKLKRGQIYISSMADLCKQVRWKKGFVYKTPTVNAMKQLWEWLRKKGMVDTKRTTRGTIMTILNYRKYQDIQKEEIKTVDTSKFPVANTKQTPTTSDGRQPLKPLKQLNKEESSPNKNLAGEELLKAMKKEGKRPFYYGDQMRWSQNKWWVVPHDGSRWLKFDGQESEIEWKQLKSIC